MPQQDTSPIKEKIMNVIKERGPSLPVHVSGEAGTSMLFASAFLSELLNEKRLKISNMKVGNTPLYYIPGQELQLENFSEHIKGKEREAFDLLKENKFLKDSEQEPAIRVALRSIKDFAIPFRKNEELFWRYYAVSENEFGKGETEKEESIDKEEKSDNKTAEITSQYEEEKSSDRYPETRKETEESEEKPEKEKPQLDIFEDKKESTESEAEPVKKTAKKTTKKAAKKSSSSRKNEKFLEKVREFLSKSSVEIKSIEGIKNDELVLIIKVNGEERLLAAYNKKRITEKEIIKAAKRAKELGMKYSILSLGELPKKVSELIDALNDMKDIGKIE